MVRGRMQTVFNRRADAIVTYCESDHIKLAHELVPWDAARAREVYEMRPDVWRQHGYPVVR